MIIYFISDLHLDVAYPELTDLFLKFIKNKAQHADALYILGDFFSIWLGDDIELPKYPEIITALQKLKYKNIPVYFIHGNRDFLIGKQFAKNTGTKILPDPYLMQFNDHNLILTHGDILCTLDRSYQLFRRIIQNSIIKWIFLKYPKNLRSKLGFWIKSKTKRYNKNYNLNNSKYDVNPMTTKIWMKKYNQALIIHGHTHKPEITDNRIVLGDWHKNFAKILKYDTNNGFLLITIFR